MKRTLSVLAIAALAAAVPVHADVIYSVLFQGVVDQTQGATGHSVGDTVTGHFDLDSTSGKFLDFGIGGKAIATGYSSSATIVPPFTDAIYSAQVSPVSTSGSSNSTFALDLSSLTSWPMTDTVFSLLTDTHQLKTNLDTVNNPLSAFPSTFNYYMADSKGNNVVALDADLTSLTATATPEPANLALLGCSLLGLGLFVRRRAR